VGERWEWGVEGGVEGRGCVRKESVRSCALEADVWESDGDGRVGRCVGDVGRVR
jgi:hypothetical protein